MAEPCCHASRRNEGFLWTTPPGSIGFSEQKPASEPSPPAPTAKASENFPEDQFGVVAESNTQETSAEESKSSKTLDGAVHDPGPLSLGHQYEPLSSEEATIARELRTLYLNFPCTPGLPLERASSLPEKDREADGPSQRTISLSRAASDPSVRFSPFSPSSPSYPKAHSTVPPIRTTVFLHHCWPSMGQRNSPHL